MARPSKAKGHVRPLCVRWCDSFKHQEVQYVRQQVKKQWIKIATTLKSVQKIFLKCSLQSWTKLNKWLIFGGPACCFKSNSSVGSGNIVIVKFTQETVDTYNILCNCLVRMVDKNFASLSDRFLTQNYSYGTQLCSQTPQILLCFTKWLQQLLPMKTAYIPDFKVLNF